jgi:uncharacterized DUF497 family protein
MELVFDWDENKARRNRVTHKVSFDEGNTIALIAVVIQ